MSSLNISIARLLYNFLDAKFRDAGIPFMDVNLNGCDAEHEPNVFMNTQIHQDDDGMVEKLTITVHLKRQNVIRTFTLEGFPKNTKEWQKFIYPGSDTRGSIHQSIQELVEWKDHILQHQSSKRRKIK